jgi:hypothetical protein
MPAQTRLGHLRSRLIPAALTALGVTLVTAGLLGYTGSAGEVTASPTAAPSTPSSSAPPSGPTLPPLVTIGPTATPPPTASPDPDRVATRIVVAALGIDLAVIEGPPGYPPCDVAMYFKEMGRPGQPRASYVYAHARTGMFLPLLRESERQNGARMLGMLVEIYSSDDRLFLYQISEVRRHQTTLDRALAATTEELWLQTSEGPRGTIPKLQVVAVPLSVGPADPAEAHPEAKPRAC